MDRLTDRHLFKSFLREEKNIKILHKNNLSNFEKKKMLLYEIFDRASRMINRRKANGPKFR